MHEQKNIHIQHYTELFQLVGNLANPWTFLRILPTFSKHRSVNIASRKGRYGQRVSGGICGIFHLHCATFAGTTSAHGKQNKKSLDVCRCIADRQHWGLEFTLAPNMLCVYLYIPKTYECLSVRLPRRQHTVGHTHTIYIRCGCTLHSCNA